MTTVELFSEAKFQEFEHGRADSDGGVTEQTTGLLPIAEVPDACQIATKTTRDALVAAEAQLQDDKTYHYWLRQQLAQAQNMNEEDCNELATSYDKLIDDNM